MSKAKWSKGKAKKFYREVGMRIALAREAVGLTQEQLAKMIGISPTAICYYEYGMRKPPLHHLLEIATVTEQPIEFFLGKGEKKEFVCPICDGKGNIEVPCYCQRMRRRERWKR